MNALKNAWAIGIAGVLSLAIFPARSWGLTETKDVTVTATIDAVATLKVERDGSSSVRGAAGGTNILFDKLDSNDGQADGNANFMYAPYRSEVDKNWHLLRMVANGGATTLSAKVVGAVGAKALKDVLDVFCGGFYPDDQSGEIGKKSAVWVPLDGFKVDTGGPFSGITSLNYRLRVAGIPAGGPFAGTVTWTLIST